MSTEKTTGEIWSPPWGDDHIVLRWSRWCGVIGHGTPADTIECGRTLKFVGYRGQRFTPGTYFSSFFPSNMTGCDVKRRLQMARYFIHDVSDGEVLGWYKAIPTRQEIWAIYRMAMAPGSNIIFRCAMISAWNRNPPGSPPIVIQPGERIAQMMFVPVIRPHFSVVPEFSRQTDRGTGGFGSTGTA